MTPYYDEGGVTIYHGDAMEILPTLAAGSVTAVVTDPPYVIGAVSAGNMASKAGGWMGSGTAAIAARDLGLRFVGIEAEERWCDLAVSRLAHGLLDFGEAS